MLIIIMRHVMAQKSDKGRSVWVAKIGKDSMIALV